DLEGVRAFFGFTDWPNGISHLDLGGRIVDVIPTPGHNPTHLAFYDSRTGVLFSGDFLLPGRLLIEDAAAYHESALRVVDFLKTRPLSHILGGHIELNAAGHAYRFGSHYHPDEHRLELAREDLAALPAAFESFNGFYARHPNYIHTNPIRNLVALAIIAVAVLIFIVWGVRRLLRRRRQPSQPSKSVLAGEGSSEEPGTRPSFEWAEAHESTSARASFNISELSPYL